MRVDEVGRLDQLGLGVVARGDDDAVLHVAVGRHQDQQHAALGQAQELDVVEHAGLARRGDHADEARQARQHLRRMGDDAAGLAGLELLTRPRPDLRLQRVQRPRGEHGVDEDAVAPGRGDAAGAGVRADDQARLFQVGHHVADGRR